MIHAYVRVYTYHCGAINYKQIEYFVYINMAKLIAIAWSWSCTLCLQSTTLRHVMQAQSRYIFITSQLCRNQNQACGNYIYAVQLNYAGIIHIYKLQPK
jgi:hypothetical protein